MSDVSHIGADWLCPSCHCIANLDEPGRPVMPCIWCGDVPADDFYCIRWRRLQWDSKTGTYA